MGCRPDAGPSTMAARTLDPSVGTRASRQAGTTDLQPSALLAIRSGAQRSAVCTTVLNRPPRSAFAAHKSITAHASPHTAAALPLMPRPRPCPCAGAPSCAAWPPPRPRSCRSGACCTAWGRCPRCGRRSRSPQKVRVVVGEEEEEEEGDDGERAAPRRTTSHCWMTDKDADCRCARLERCCLPSVVQCASPLLLPACLLLLLCAGHPFAHHLRAGHVKDVTGVTWSPDSKALATSGHDKTVRLWDAGTGQCMAVLQVR